MPQSFRIGIGRCDCRSPYGNAIQKMACEAINARMESWRPRLPSDLSAVPAEFHETHVVDGRVITFGTYKEQLPSGGWLVVFQALVRTWSRPTLLSFGAVGRLYAEGLVVSTTGTVEVAPDELMWGYR